MSTDVTNNYGHRPINATVLDAAQMRDRAANKKVREASVANHEDFKRVKKGKRVIVNPLPEEEEYLADGTKLTKKTSTKTTRTDR